MFTTNSKYDSDGILGLQIHENNYLTYGHGLVSQLKLNNLINKEIFFFNFDTPNDEGELIIGDYPHLIDKFSDKYKKNQLETTGIHIPSLDILYNLLFRSVFWDGKEIETPKTEPLYSEYDIMRLGKGKQLVIYQGWYHRPIEAEQVFHFYNKTPAEKKLHEKVLMGESTPLPEFLIPMHHAIMGYEGTPRVLNPNTNEIKILEPLH